MVTIKLMIDFLVSWPKLSYNVCVCCSYVAELCALYERYKHVAGYPQERTLTVLEAPEAARRRRCTL